MEVPFGEIVAGLFGEEDLAFVPFGDAFCGGGAAVVVDGEDGEVLCISKGDFGCHGVVIFINLAVVYDGAVDGGFIGANWSCNNVGRWAGRWSWTFTFVKVFNREFIIAVSGRGSMYVCCTLVKEATALEAALWVCDWNLSMHCVTVANEVDGFSR
jgi:hypothetical protein